jgi:hypothetical protein
MYTFEDETNIYFALRTSTYCALMDCKTLNQVYNNDLETSFDSVYYENMINKAFENGDCDNDTNITG